MTAVEHERRPSCKSAFGRLLRQYRIAAGLSPRSARRTRPVRTATESGRSSAAIAARPSAKRSHSCWCAAAR